MTDCGRAESATAGASVRIEGRVVPIVHSYRASPPLLLHSLADLIEYECVVCRCRRQSAMVALDGDETVCPRCYAHLRFRD